MSPTPPPPHARSARLAISVLFFANGALIASVVPRLPAIKTSLGLSNAELGAAVAALPVGGLIAGGLVGMLIARFGSGRSAAFSGVLCCLVIAGIGLAPSLLALAAVYFVLGVFDATMDASMNTHGLVVQRAYGRSILQGFHGTWSLGGMAAGALGAAAAGIGVPVAAHLAIVGLVLALIILATSGPLLAGRSQQEPDRSQVAAGPSERMHAGNAPRLLRILLPVAMLGIMTAIAQAAASTWSAVYLTESLGLSAGVAAIAFVLYAASMTVGRLVNDRFVDRLGAIAMVRMGALMAAAGLVLAIAAGPLHLPVIAFAGFAAIGLGTSPMFPVMITAAGTRPGITAGYGVALAAWLVRIGMVVAPTLIGLAADSASLGAAFVIPLVTVLVMIPLAPILAGVRWIPRPLRDMPATPPA